MNHELKSKSESQTQTYGTGETLKTSSATGPPEENEKDEKWEMKK